MSRIESQSRHARGASGRPLGRSLRRRLHTVATMLRSGGLVVTTPAEAGGADPVHARTLIQFDGDMVTSIVASKLRDRQLVERHFSAVNALLADVDRLRKQLVAAVVGAVLVVPSIGSAAAFLASADRDWTALAWALGVHGVSATAIGAALAAGRRWILARVLGWGREEFGTPVRDGPSPEQAHRPF